MHFSESNCIAHPSTCFVMNSCLIMNSKQHTTNKILPKLGFDPLLHFLSRKMVEGEYFLHGMDLVHYFNLVTYTFKQLFPVDSEPSNSYLTSRNADK